MHLRWQREKNSKHIQLPADAGSLMPVPVKHLVFVINPGSSSTKLALFRAQRMIADRTVRHAPPTAGSIWSDFEERLDGIRQALREMRGNTRLDAVVGRGGLLRPLQGGTYRIDDRMVADARANLQGEHAANLGCAFAEAIGREEGAPAFTVDPVSVDEFEPIARYSGHPAIERRALSHALNLHAVARACAEKNGIPFRRSRFVVAHLGGGISIAPLRGGRIIDVNDASSDGPFSPDRTGGLPLQPFIGMCFSGAFTEKEMRKLVMGTGGLIAYLGTNDLMEIERRIDAGDRKAAELVEAMCYQIGKEIAAMAAVLQGKVHGVILTGGLAHSARVRSLIRKYAGWIAPVHNYAGEHEMAALAQGALRVLRGMEEALTY